MAARKSRPAKDAPLRAAIATAGRVFVQLPTKAAHAKIAQLTAALEAEHKLAGVHATEKAQLELAFAAYRRDAEARYAALQRDYGELTLSRYDATNELEALKADSVAEIKRLRRELIEAAGDVAMHRARDERGAAALAALALRYGDLAAEMFKRYDDEALTAGRHEARNG